MAAPRQQQQQPDKDRFLRTCQGLAIIGPREAGGAGIWTRDECRTFLNEREGTSFATEADTVGAPRHPAFQAFLAGLSPDEITQLELAILAERHAIDTWTPARIDVPVPDGGLAVLDDPPDEEL